MKKFLNLNHVAFSGTSRDYITREAVVRANDRMMGGKTVYKVALEDIYEKHELARPTREQIESAAVTAMRQLAVAR